MNRRTCVLVALFILEPVGAAGQERGLTCDGVIDACYSRELDGPLGRAGAHATEPARHNEFAINLA